MKLERKKKGVLYKRRGSLEAAIETLCQQEFPPWSHEVLLNREMEGADFFQRWPSHAVSESFLVLVMSLCVALRQMCSFRVRERPKPPAQHPWHHREEESYPNLQLKHPWNLTREKAKTF